MDVRQQADPDHEPVAGQPETAAPPAGLAELALAVSRLQHPAFAVLDGAHWDDMPTKLERAGLGGRSLYLGAGQAVEAAGPWLVSLDQRPDAVGALMELLGERPAAVFWGCEAGEAALWRHLRTLNQIEIARVPDAAEPGLAVPGGADAAAGNAGLPTSTGEGSEIVSFRHWDPRGLGSVLPLLDAAQFARMFGPANEVVFLDPPAHGGFGVRRAVRTPDLPIAPHGRMRLSAEQVLALDEAVQVRSTRRIGRYLRETAPEEAAHLTDGQLHKIVEDSAAEGRLLGLRSERAQGQWAYLAITTGGVIGRDGKVVAHVARGQDSPDTNLDVLFARMVRLAQEEARAVGQR